VPKERVRPKEGAIKGQKGKGQEGRGVILLQKGDQWNQRVDTLGKDFGGRQCMIGYIVNSKDSRSEGENCRDGWIDRGWGQIREVCIHWCHTETILGYNWDLGKLL